MLDLSRAFGPVGGRAYTVLPDGSVRLDRAKRRVKPFTLLTEPESITVAAATDMTGGFFADQLPVPAIMEIDGKAPFEARYISFHARRTDTGVLNDQFTVKIMDPQERPLLMNREIHVRTLAGGFGSSLGAAANAGGRPLVLPETFFMDPEQGGRALVVEFRNLNTFEIAIRLGIHGVRYTDFRAYEKALREREEMFGRGRIAYPFFATTDRHVRLTASQADTFDLRLSDDSDAELVKLARYSDGNFLARIVEMDGKRYLDNAGQDTTGGQSGVFMDFMFGDAEFPFIPYETAYWERGTKLQVWLEDLSAAVNNVWVTLVSRKIRYGESIFEQR